MGQLIRKLSAEERQGNDFPLPNYRPAFHAPIGVTVILGRHGLLGACCFGMAVTFLKKNLASWGSLPPPSFRLGLGCGPCLVLNRHGLSWGPSLKKGQKKKTGGARFCHGVDQWG